MINKKKSCSNTKIHRATKKVRRLQRQAIFALFLIVVIVFLIIKYHSLPNNYRVIVFEKDNSITNVQFTTDYKTAQHLMQKQIKQGAYNPAIIEKDEKIVAIKYGIVNFKTKDCKVNTYYTSVYSDRQNYINGCYGSDGAYLETDSLGKKIKFKIAGDIGWIDLDEVELINAFDTNSIKSKNHYIVKNSIITHYGTNDLKKEKHSIQIPIGTASFKLDSTNPLYSYDGHYFYTSFAQMIDDYRNDTYINSINKDNPHYNYYQYLSHRAKTSYLSNEINWYLNTYQGFNEKPSQYPSLKYQSQLYNEGYNLISAQNTYGVNALMMLALAINESAFGKSQIAITKNNLFGHAAYDYSPNESATGYKSVADSILVHANLILNRGFLNPCDEASSNSLSPKECLNLNNRYAGGHFGDKASGMNIKYASDPYWGEKAARYYQDLDKVLGLKDLNRYNVKILENPQTRNIYAQPDTKSTVLYIIPKYAFMPVVILQEVKDNDNNTWYKILLDGQVNAHRNEIITHPDEYNYQNNYGYIPASYFNLQEKNK